MFVPFRTTTSLHHQPNMTLDKVMPKSWTSMKRTMLAIPAGRRLGMDEARTVPKPRPRPGARQRQRVIARPRPRRKQLASASAELILMRMMTTISRTWTMMMRTRTVTMMRGQETPCDQSVKTFNFGRCRLPVTSVTGEIEAGSSQPEKQWSSCGFEICTVTG